jgi:hypothetical protein
MAIEDGVTGATADGLESTGRKLPRRRADVQPRAAAPATTATPRARRKPSKRTLATWCTQLERQGFTASEARRIVFEKAHPRDEGLARN